MTKIVEHLFTQWKKKCDSVCFNNNCVPYLVREKKPSTFLKKIEDSLSKQKSLTLILYPPMAVIS